MTSHLGLELAPGWDTTSQLRGRSSPAACPIFPADEEIRCVRKILTGRHNASTTIGYLSPFKGTCFPCATLTFIRDPLAVYVRRGRRSSGSESMTLLPKLWCDGEGTEVPQDRGNGGRDSADSRRPVESRGFSIRFISRRAGPGVPCGMRQPRKSGRLRRQNESRRYKVITPVLRQVPRYRLTLKQSARRARFYL